VRTERAYVADDSSLILGQVWLSKGQTARTRTGFARYQKKEARATLATLPYVIIAAAPLLRLQDLKRAKASSTLRPRLQTPCRRLPSWSEGIVSKRLTSVYKSGPSKARIKVKNPKSPGCYTSERGDFLTSSIEIEELRPAIYVDHQK
jgi:hypothetical protein